MSTTVVTIPILLRRILRPKEVKQIPQGSPSGLVEIGFETK